MNRRDLLFCVAACATSGVQYGRARAAAEAPGQTTYPRLQGHRQSIPTETRLQECLRSCEAVLEKARRSPRIRTAAFQFEECRRLVLATIRRLRSGDATSAAILQACADSCRRTFEIGLTADDSAIQAAIAECLRTATACELQLCQ